MPSVNEINELLNCPWVYTQINGVNGYKVTGKNGNSIFLPKVSPGYSTSDGGYGSTRPILTFDDIGPFINNFMMYKYYGCKIRPVITNPDVNEYPVE